MRQAQNRPIRFFIGSFALLSAAGCGDTSGPSGAQDPGVLLVTLTQGSEDLAYMKSGI
jgi:hypothetical protein